MVVIQKTNCMVPTPTATCDRPSQSVFWGNQGPYFRCGKHTRIMQQQNPKVSLI